MVERPSYPRWINSNGPIATITINISGLIEPRRTVDVAMEGVRERAAQDLKWGFHLLPDAPAGVKFHNAYFGICTEEAAKKNCEHAMRAGGCSLGHVLIEEVAEAIAAIPDPVQLRAELVQVMGVAIKWIEQIDLRQGYGGVDGKVIAVDELAREGNAHG
jgi:hypothetical protein